MVMKNIFILYMVGIFSFTA